MGREEAQPGYLHSVGWGYQTDTKNQKEMFIETKPWQSWLL